jgi:predicted RNA-binding protein with EMAP domain
MAMTSIERITNILDLKPVDKIAVDITPWPETIKLWSERRYIKEGDSIPEIRELFNGDLQTDMEVFKLHGFCN